MHFLRSAFRDSAGTMRICCIVISSFRLFTWWVPTNLDSRLAEKVLAAELYEENQFIFVAAEYDDFSYRLADERTSIGLDHYLIEWMVNCAAKY